MDGTIAQPTAIPIDAARTLAVVLDAPRRLALREVALSEPDESDVIVEVDWSGISAGTERLLWSGEMPPFPGLAYPLVPGYESVGRVVHAGSRSGRRVGAHVFVPGSAGFRDVRGLFGGAAARLVSAGARTVEIGADLGDRAVLLALAATASHALDMALEAPSRPGADGLLIVGHGALGRLLARLAIARGASTPVVWESDPTRRVGHHGYAVVDPAEDDRRDYAFVVDVSGDADLVDGLVSRLGPRGVLVLAGFYRRRIAFDFVPAFLRETRIRVAAEWQPADLERVSREVAEGRLPLDGLITNHASPCQAEDAYEAAFGDPTCIKMVLNWRDLQ